MAHITARPDFLPLRDLDEHVQIKGGMTFGC